MKPQQKAIVEAFDRVKVCFQYHRKWISFSAFAQAIHREHDLEESKSFNGQSLLEALRAHPTYKNSFPTGTTVAIGDSPAVSFNRLRRRNEKPVFYCCIGNQPDGSWLEHVVTALPKETHCNIGHQAKTDLKNALAANTPK